MRSVVVLHHSNPRPWRGVVNVAFGSGTDLRRHHQEGLLLGVKRTYFAKKRTSASECRLLGDKQTYQRHGSDFRL
jgi:hypothetical protein